MCSVKKQIKQNKTPSNVEAYILKPVYQLLESGLHKLGV